MDLRRKEHGVDHGASTSSGMRRGVAIDAVVAAVVLAYHLLTHAASVPESLWAGTGVVLGVGLCVPYLIRRRHPLAAFGLTFVVGVVQVMLGVSLMPADVMVGFALYAVAATHGWVHTAIAAVLAAVLMIASSARFLELGYLRVGEVGVLVALVALAAAGGALARARRRSVDDLRAIAAAERRDRESSLRMAVADERARIAREIHDIVSHSLSVVVLMADGAAERVHDQPERARDAMRTVRDTGREAIGDMRRMLGVLRTDEPGSHAPQPTVADIQGLVDAAEAAGTQVQLSIDGDLGRLGRGVQLTVYRIVQEALTNVRRHAGAGSRAVVVVDVRSDDLFVRVIDDGRAQSARAEDHGPPGHGLVGMRERVAMHGGTIDVGPRRPHGFAVEARLPLGGRA